MTIDLACDDVISPDVGIVHRLDDGLAGFTHPRLAPAYAQTCNTEAVLGAPHEPRAGGLAADLPTARAAALGESVERYSACHVPRSRLRRLPAGDVAPDWLDPAGSHPPTCYVKGWRLSTAAAEPAWIAASRVYLDSADPLDEIAVPTSTGLACHVDPWSALRSALLEVVERDAVMVTWLARLPARAIRTSLQWRTPAGHHVRFDRAVERYRLYQLLSPLGIPVVLGVAFGGRGQPGAAVGAAAHLDITRACRRALVEAAQTFQYAQVLLARGRAVPERADDVADLEDHVAYYLPPERARAFDLLDSSPAEPLCVDLTDLAPDSIAADDIGRIVTAAERAGMSCYAADATAPDVRQAGLWVVRAVIPALFPLVVGRERHSRHPRLASVDVLNRDPHPFP